MVQARVSKGVLLDGAQMSLSAFLAGTIGFLKERNIPIEDWTAYIGHHFEDSWGALEGAEPGRILRHLIALQVRPLGAEVQTSQITAQSAEVTLTPLPNAEVMEKFGTTPRDLLRGFRVTQREMASVYGIFEAPAAAIGLRFTHQLKGGQQVLKLEPAAGVQRVRRERRRPGQRARRARGTRAQA